MCRHIGRLANISFNETAHKNNGDKEEEESTAQLARRYFTEV
jgi:hypothetical protein